MNRFFRSFGPLRAAACSALLALSAGCAEFDSAEQDVSLRYQASGDRIEFNVDTRGIFATSTKFGQSEADVLARAKGRVEELAAGARAFKLMAFPFIVDLDRDGGEDVKWLTKEQSERIFTLMRASVSVASADAHLDGAGDVALTQRFEINNATAFMAAANELVTLGVQHELARDAKQPFDSTKLHGTEASQKNLRSFMDRGEPWVSLDAEALVVRVPMTAHDLALCMKDLVRETDEEAGAAALYRALFANLEELTVADGVASFRFSASASSPASDKGKVEWSFRAPRNPDAKKLVAAFDGDELK